MFRRWLGGAKPTPERTQAQFGSNHAIGKPQVPSTGASASTSASSGPPSPGASSRSTSRSHGAACAAAEDRAVITVVRSSLWSQAGCEDVWKVEIRSSASVAELKARIAALYEIPVQVQRLQRTPDPRDLCLPESCMVRDFERRPIYLLPELGAQDPQREAIHQELEGIHLDVDADDGGEEEQMRAARAVAESLQGVLYNVAIVRPRDPNGAFTEASSKLKVEALSLVGDVQAMAEAELIGDKLRDRHWCLLFNGQPLPPHVPIHFAGIGDGDTLLIVPGSPPDDEDAYDSDSDSLDDAILNWASSS